MTTITETAPETSTAELRRPGPLDLAAGVLLFAAVVLHVVAMFPTYFAGSGSLSSQSQEVALYAVLAGAWALALVFGLTGPHRTPIAAGLAIGIAVTELGFRVSDAGDAIRYGTGRTGLWLMTVAWGVGAVAAVVAALAARARYAARPGPAEIPEGEWQIDWAEPAPLANPYTGETDPAPVIHAPMPLPSAGALPVPEEDPHERMAWTGLVVILAVVVAGTFLPPWDHGVALNVASGHAVTRNLGNAFDAAWQEILGSVLTAAALLAVPIIGIRLRNRAVGAALVVGSLLVLGSQFVAAVIQVNDPASTFGLTPAQAKSLGLDLSLKLTGWFTVNALAAYALFATVMVWATLRHHHENSAGTTPIAP